MPVKQLDITKPMQLRDGSPVRLICSDRKNYDFPLVILCEDRPGEEVTEHNKTNEFVGYRTREGRAYIDRGGDNPLDVINVPAEPVVRYHNVYKHGPPGLAHKTLERAISQRRIAEPILFVVKSTETEDEPTPSYEIVHTYGDKDNGDAE